MKGGRRGRASFGRGMTVLINSWGRRGGRGADKPTQAWTSQTRGCLSHGSQGRQGRHLRGWTLGCGSHTSRIRRCPNSVARLRSSPANHDKNCCVAISPPPSASTPLQPVDRFILSPAKESERRLGEGESRSVCHEDCLEEGGLRGCTTAELIETGSCRNQETRPFDGR